MGYYEDGRVHYRAWMEAAFGYGDDIIGSHAGISDTSQMLHVRAAGIRKDQLKPWGGAKDSGVSGDPMKATPATSSSVAPTAGFVISIIGETSRRATSAR